MGATSKEHLDHAPSETAMRCGSATWTGSVLSRTSRRCGHARCARIDRCRASAGWPPWSSACRHDSIGPDHQPVKWTGPLREQAANRMPGSASRTTRASPRQVALPDVPAGRLPAPSPYPSRSGAVTCSLVLCLLPPDRERIEERCAAPPDPSPGNGRAPLIDAPCPGFLLCFQNRLNLKKLAAPPQPGTANPRENRDPRKHPVVRGEHGEAAGCETRPPPARIGPGRILPGNRCMQRRPKAPDDGRSPPDGHVMCPGSDSRMKASWRCGNVK